MGYMEAGATQLDPPTQEEAHTGAAVTGRMSFGQAWEIVKEQLATDVGPEEMEGEPATKRRRMEAQVIDIATCNEGDAIVKWQVMISYDNDKTWCGECWADLDHQWANECEHLYQITKGWTDHMWMRTIEVDAPPQVQGGQKDRRPRHTIEFHSGGATQVSHSTNTRRTVRRVEVTMGFDQGYIARDQYKLHNPAQGHAGSMMPQGNLEYEHAGVGSTQDRAAAWTPPTSGVHHHGQDEPA